MKVKYKIILTGILAFALVPLLVIYTSAEKVTYTLDYLQFLGEGTFGFEYQDDAGNVVTDTFTRSGTNVRDEWAEWSVNSLGTEFRDRTFTVGVFNSSNPYDYTGGPAVNGVGSIYTSFPLLGDPSVYGQVISGQSIQLCWAFYNGDGWWYTLNLPACYVTYEDPDGTIYNWYNGDNGVLFTSANMMPLEFDGGAIPCFVLDLSSYSFTGRNIHYGGQFHIQFVWNILASVDYVTTMFVGLSNNSTLSFGTDGELPPSDTVPPVTLPPETLPPSLPNINDDIQSGANNLNNKFDKVTAPPVEWLGQIPDSNSLGIGMLWSSQFGSFLVSACVFSLGIATIGYHMHGKR